MRLRPRIATALALLLALIVAVPSVASASTRKDIFHDCSDGQIDGHYSQQAYADALAHLPADVDEYTDCRSQIQRAQLGGGGSSGSGGGTSGGGGATAGAGGGGGGTSGGAVNGDTDRKSTRLNSSHTVLSRMPSSA